MPWEPIHMDIKVPIVLRLYLKRVFFLIHFDFSSIKTQRNFIDFYLEETLYGVIKKIISA